MAFGRWLYVGVEKGCLCLEFDSARVTFPKSCFSNFASAFLEIPKRQVRWEMEMGKEERLRKVAAFGFCQSERERE